MEPFLLTTAQHLYQIHQPKFDTLAIVLPNRRSGVFLTEYLKQINHQTIWLPKILTISEFVSEISTLQLAEPINLLGALYNIYKQISGSNEPFDEFYVWGQIMLNDFDDTDKYLVNPQAIFTNTREFKQLDNHLDFLTTEQVAILKQFFDQFDPEKKTRLKENFLEIWQILLPIYNQFTEHCHKTGYAYEGHLYKQAAQTITNGQYTPKYHHIAFVGFNAINQCEVTIFEGLKRLNVASFYWDYDPFYLENKEQEAGFFMRKFVKQFPPPQSFNLQSNLTNPNKHLELISAPTASGQFNQAASLIEQLTQSNFSNTALVLADENLLQPALANMPAHVTEVNITMGHPFSNSLTASLLELLFELQNTRRDSKGQATFYHKKALAVLRHPYLTALAADDCTQIIQKNTQSNRFYIPEPEFHQHPIISLIFKPINQATEFSIYLNSVIDQLTPQLLNLPDNPFQIELEFLYYLHITLNKVTNQLAQNNLTVALPTFFKLLKKALSGILVPFEGEPISGLQIMGFLETRNLDFENIIITSFNEGQLPVNQNSASFIPHSLRKGFGMPTREHHDAMYAYYFFRLLQRAKNVYLIYCNSADGLFTGEPSRFAYQLKYSQWFNLTTLHYHQPLKISGTPNITIVKTGEVLVNLNKFKGTTPQHTLSPSSITTYITCPLKFYFHSVLRLFEADTIEEDVDARIFGELFHLAAQTLYQPFIDQTLLATPQELKRIENNQQLITDAIQTAFNATMAKNAQQIFSIEGKNILVAKALETYLKALLQTDANLGNISFKGLEAIHYRPITLPTHTQQSTTITIKGTIDRIDLTEAGLRIVDYKTGSDDLKFNALNELFEPTLIKKHKAIIQTFIYAWLCEPLYPLHQPVIPTVYRVKQLLNPNLSTQVNGAVYNGDFKSIISEFNQMLTQVVEQIFNETIPFTQTTNTKHCEFCPYNGICKK